MKTKRARFTIVEDLAAEIDPADKLVVARTKFGGPFAHEIGTKWKVRSVPVLTEWMQSRGKTT